MKSKMKGSIGESLVLTELISKGLTISLPYGDNAKYDLVADDGQRLYRIQVKTTETKIGDVVAIGYISTRIYDKKTGTNNRTKVVTYNERDFDLLALVDVTTKTMCFVPAKSVAGKKQLNMKLSVMKGWNNSAIL